MRKQELLKELNKHQSLQSLLSKKETRNTIWTVVVPVAGLLVSLLYILSRLG